MSGNTAIWILVAIIVLIALGALVFALAQRNKNHQAEQARHEAAELRAQAAGQQSQVQDADLQAREAQLEADRARLQAEQAEAQAAEARTAHQFEEARVEDQVREADRVDPDVDHTSDDYRPTTATQPAQGDHDAAHTDSAHTDSDGDGRADTHETTDTDGDGRTDTHRA